MYKQDELVIILGDFNGQVGDEKLGVKQQFNESTKNDNRERLIMLCANNNLCINSTFFDHKLQRKYTWENARGYRSTINYILTNKNIYPSQILDVRSIMTAESGRDHRMMLGKLRLKLKCKQ